MVVRLAFVGNCVVFWRAVVVVVCNFDVVIIIWLVLREDKGVEVVCVVLVLLVLDVSEVEVEVEGEGFREGEVIVEEVGGVVEITVVVLLEAVFVVFEKRSGIESGVLYTFLEEWWFYLVYIRIN